MPGEALYGRTAEGGFELVPDGDGDLWDPDWPVIMVDWHSACAYARWMAARTGLRWRLPVELEVEKATRGVDGRLRPWGDHFDPTWACTVDSHRGTALPVSIHSFEVDCSVYGVRGASGNVRIWCADHYLPEPAVVDSRAIVAPSPASHRGMRNTRGGTWAGRPTFGRCANRSGSQPESRTHYIGIRLARSLPLSTD